MNKYLFFVKIRIMFNSIWYQNLVKPYFSPPALVFAPAWTVLYLMIFISFTLFILKPTTQHKGWGVFLFVVQMILNLLWIPAFFYLHNISLALAIIVLLDIFVIFTMIEFYKVSKASAILLAPYLVWILFATYLTSVYCVLN